MSLSDDVIDVLLIALVLRQVRVRELTAGSVLLPTALVDAVLAEAPDQQ